MNSVRTKKMKIFSGNANLPLAQEIADYLKIPLGGARVNRFSDGEINIEITDSVRGADVFIIQPTCPPVNENLMELLILIDALKRASARRIAAVIPYYGYARQERKARARDPITAKLVANLITTAGAGRVVCLDLHAGAIQGFFDIPVDHLLGVPILAEYFQQKCLENLIVVAPDLGGVTRARSMADRLGTSIAIIEKRRPGPNKSEVMNIIGDVKNCTALLVDDIIDTAGTITQGAAALMAAGVREVYACCTHPILSGPAVDRLRDSVLKEVVVTNTIPLPEDKKLEKIKVLSVAPLLGEAVIRIYKYLSISKLFD